MRKIPVILFFVSICFTIPLPVSVAAKECILIESEEMQRYYEDKQYAYDNMFLFDIRPYREAIRGKEIPLIKGVSYDMFKVEYLYDVELWKGKDVFLVGRDTQSTIVFCREMIKKKYGVNDIYVLKGGMEAWEGPVRKRFEEIECEGIDSRELRKMKEAETDYQLMDWRYPEHFLSGHVPGSLNGYREKIYGGLEDMLRGYFFSRPIYIKIMKGETIGVFIEYGETGSRHRCRIEKWATGIENMFYLKGGVEGWDGSVEKGSAIGH